jgi:hypothetical protein
MENRPTHNDFRYLQLFEKMDQKRVSYWLKNEPEEIATRNSKRLKILIGRAFTSDKVARETDPRLIFAQEN